MKYIRKINESDETNKIFLNIEYCDNRKNLIKFLKESIEVLEDDSNYDKWSIEYHKYNDNGTILINTIQS
tara:strand:- start:30183 stop:30392 length:210 start_codon:yes stop_codon:yes gene_type:complete